jgi:hypothetical protein
MANELSPTLIRLHRADTLRFATALTVDKADPVSVTVNAIPIQEWMEKGDADEQKNRHAALRRAHENRDYAQRNADNAPELLIAEAEVFYAFLKAA